jgi:hypothetical protein
MADLTSTGVVVLDAWSESGITGKRVTARKVTLTLAGAGSGAASNKIPASALGFATIEHISSFIKSDNAVVVPAAPNVAGTEIILGGGTTGAATSYTGDFTGIVRGQTTSFNT